MYSNALTAGDCLLGKSTLQSSLSYGKGCYGLLGMPSLTHRKRASEMARLSADTRISRSYVWV